MKRANQHSLILTLLFVGAAFAVSGCKSDSKTRYYPAASTGAPTTSGTNPGTPTNPPPPPPPMLTTAMVSSFDQDEVIDVDMRTGAVNNRYAVGDMPTDVTNDIIYSYVANAGDQSVTSIDRLANNTVGTIDVAASPLTGISNIINVDGLIRPMVRPAGLAVTPNGNKIVSANLINVSVIDASTQSVQKSLLGLNLPSLNNILNSQSWATFLAAPAPGLGMAKVAATNDTAFVTCMLSGNVMRIDIASQNPTVLGYTSVGQAPIGITIAGNKAYVACALSQEVVVLDVATGQVTGRVAAGMIPVDVSANQAGDKVYVANAISGDITVIDTMTDMVVQTLPAGMSIMNIFQTMGIQVPAGGATGMNALLNGFLQGFSAGLNNPSSFGALLIGGNGNLLSPANLINGLISGFLAYAGVNQQQMAGLNLPGIGIMSIGVAHDPTLVCSGNAFLGELVVTESTTSSVNTVPNLTGMGPVDVAPIWRR